MKTLSLQAKILTIFIISLLTMFLVMTAMHFKDLSRADMEISRFARKGHTIALQGAIAKQKINLEKMITGMLNTDELLVFASDPSNKTARTTVRGLLISLDSLGASRLTIYDKNFNVILQEVNSKLNKRPNTLPDVYQQIFLKTSKTYETEYYYRHNETHESAFPVEYCAANVLTDDNDEITGYIEIALYTHLWAKDLAKLTDSIVSFYDSDIKDLSFSVEPETGKEIITSLGKKPLQDRSYIRKVKDKSYISDVIPVLSPDKNIIHWLIISSDYTAQKAAISKNRSISITFICVVTLLTILLTIIFLKRGIISPIIKMAKSLDESGSMLDQLGIQVSTSSELIANASSAHAAAQEETSATLEETSAMINQNAENSRQASEYVMKTLKVIQDGEGKMSQLAEAMREISTASDETIKIVKTIDEIAFQTNLLALNAAVEAARAGDAGAGFAVVADEVRNLAMRAATAAKNTSALIEETALKIQSGSQLAEKTNEGFQSIVQSSKQITSIIADISSASEDQSHGMQQLNIAVSDMDTATQQNAATAEEGAAVAEEMRAQVGAIKANIDQLFNLVDGGGSQSTRDLNTSKHLAKLS